MRREAPNAPGMIVFGASKGRTSAIKRNCLNVVFICYLKVVTNRKIYIVAMLIEIMKEKYTRDEPTVKSINSLVSKAFGTFIRGNWEEAGEIRKTDRLSNIGRREISSLLALPVVWPIFLLDEILGVFTRKYSFSSIKKMGVFNSQDGSDLTVKKEFYDDAMDYACLYKERFGRWPKVRVSPESEMGQMTENTENKESY